MKLYRFSPIQDSDTLREAILYVVHAENQLADKIIGATLPITYLTIFAHYDSEYDVLINIIDTWGEVAIANNGHKVTLTEPITKDGQRITELRIRRPDPYRMQVGCCDFGVDDFSSFKTAYLGSRKGLRLIERPEYQMVEFFDPDSDVLAYVVW
jgi:hypothetical protein